MVFLQAITPCIQGLEAESWRDFTNIAKCTPCEMVIGEKL